MTEAEEKHLEAEYGARFDEQASAEPYHVTWDEDGSFEVRRRAVLREQYIQGRFECRSVESLMGWRGFPTFGAAKTYLVRALSSWRDEIARSARDARDLRKSEIE